MTSSYLSIGAGGPEAAMSMALKIQASGDDFKTIAETLAARIEECEHGAPWGHDKYGDAFHDGYTGKPGNGEIAANVALRTSLTEAGSTLSDMGHKVVEAMGKYSALEADNAADIGGTTA
jgi:hypothetical protein